LHRHLLEIRFPHPHRLLLFNLCRSHLHPRNRLLLKLLLLTPRNLYLKFRNHNLLLRSSISRQ
jgi:hypothetical protein